MNEKMLFHAIECLLQIYRKVTFDLNSLQKKEEEENSEILSFTVLTWNVFFDNLTSNQNEKMVHPLYDEKLGNGTVNWLDSDSRKEGEKKRKRKKNSKSTNDVKEKEKLIQAENLLYTI